MTALYFRTLRPNGLRRAGKHRPYSEIGFGGGSVSALESSPSGSVARGGPSSSAAPALGFPEDFDKQSIAGRHAALPSVRRRDGTALHVLPTAASLTCAGGRGPRGRRLLRRRHPQCPSSPGNNLTINFNMLVELRRDRRQRIGTRT
jgi:hypothetical protein